MIGREDKEEFDDACFWKYMKKREVTPYVWWLLSDPARFIKLANDWVKEHKEVKP
jgi:hypothetical protein